jgi:hypothetical protein
MVGPHDTRVLLRGRPALRDCTQTSNILEKSWAIRFKPMQAIANHCKVKNKNHFFLRAEGPAAPKSDVGGGKAGLPGL